MMMGTRGNFVAKGPCCRQGTNSAWGCKARAWLLPSPYIRGSMRVASGGGGVPCIEESLDRSIQPPSASVPYIPLCALSSG